MIISKLYKASRGFSATAEPFISTSIFWRCYVYFYLVSNSDTVKRPWSRI